MRIPTARRGLAAGLALVAACALGGAGGRVAVAARADLSARFTPPPIRHVWLVQLENLSFDESITNNPNKFLSRVLPASGEVLTQYYGTGHFSLDNYISQLSGQAPNADTQGDCQVYSDVGPASQVIPAGPMAGQATGAGCVYPASVLTLADQLSAKGLTWRGYMEDMGNDPARDGGTPVAGGGTACAHPAALTRDGTQSAAATDQYAARHNPFVYFHSIIDSPSCVTNDVPLRLLATDLASVATTPSFSFVTPNLCNDAHDATCTGPTACSKPAGGPGGLIAADCWLQTWIPRIIASPAYQQDGMVIVTFDESNVVGSNGGIGDAASCCGELPGPGSPLPGQTGMGGGHIAMVILSKYVRPGSTNAVGGAAPQAYNHYSLLRSLEDLFGITTGGSDGLGHLGYAGASGLVPFGADVYNNPSGGGGALVPTPAAPVNIPGLPTAGPPVAAPNTGASAEGLTLPAAAVLAAGLGALCLVAGRRRTR